MSTVITERLSISVLTGFLGSGKTTLLSRLIREPQMANTAVIINEFGEVGLDHLLVARSEENMVLMGSGCLCCTIRADLSETLRDLHQKRIRGKIPPFERVVIETTGLADPLPILHTLTTDPLLKRVYRLDGVVTTVDAVHGLRQLNRQIESVHQAAVADRIVITKSDIADPARTAMLRRQLETLNPGAAIYDAMEDRDKPLLLFDASQYSLDGKNLDIRKWLGADAHEHHHEEHDEHGHHDHHHDVNRHSQAIGSFCLTIDRPVTWGTMVGFLDALGRLRGSDLLRVKGLVNIEESELPVVIQGVQTLFHPPAQLDAWPDEDRTSRLVFITRDIPKEPIQELLDVCLKAAENDLQHRASGEKGVAIMDSNASAIGSGGPEKGM